MGDIDISREAVSKEIAALQKCEADPRCYYQFEETRALLSALRAALDAAEARAVGEHDPECRLVERGQTCNCGAALHPASPLGAVVMREKAAQEILTAGDSTVTEALGQRLCCNGHHCGCQGSTVEQFLVHNIRALPLPTDDELLAAAAELPAVKALVVACKVADQVSRDLGWHRIYDVTGPALAPFTRKGE